MRAPAARAITLTIHRAIRGATRGATWRGYLAGLRGGYLWGCAGEPIFRCTSNKSTSAKPLQTNGTYMPIRSLLTRAPLLTRVPPCGNCPTPRLAVVSAGLQTAAPGSPVSTPVLPMGSHGGAYACQDAQESTAQPSTKVSPPRRTRATAGGTSLRRAAIRSARGDTRVLMGRHGGSRWGHMGNR
jgi:hypothetical protein